MENKIPPPIVLIAFLLLMKGVQIIDPLANQYLARADYIGLVFALLGVLSAVLGVARFARAKTTVDPLRPNKASSLVRSGVFRISRNPMYLGMALVSIGFAFHLQSPMAFLGVFGFIAYIKHFQIRPEERAMKELFGDEFVEYAATTRRWI